MFRYSMSPEQDAAENRAKRARTIRNVALSVIGGAAVMFGMWSLVALDKVNEGNFAVGRGINGMYKEDFIKPGFSFNYLTRVYEIDGRNNLINIADLRPKDRDGLLLQDLDMNIIYNVNPERSVSFIREFRDINPSEGDPGVYTLGKSLLAKEAQRIAMEVIRGFGSSDMLDSPAEVEDVMRAKLQQRMDSKFGEGLFEIAGVNIANIQVAPTVEQRIAATAAQEASAAVARAQEESLEARASAELKEAQSLAEISRKTGVSVNQLIEVRRLNVLAMLPSDTVKPTIEVSRPPAPSP